MLHPAVARLKFLPKELPFKITLKDGRSSPGEAQTHTVEDLQTVVATRHIYPALKDCNPSSTAIRAHRGHHCPPSGKSQSRRGAMRFDVLSSQDSLSGFGQTVLCSLVPWTTSPPPTASTTTAADGSLWLLSPKLQTHSWSPLISTGTQNKHVPNKASLLQICSSPALPSLVNGTASYLVAVLTNSAFVWPLLPHSQHSWGLT